MKRPGLLTALCLFVWVGTIAMLAFSVRTDWQAKGYPHWFSGYVLAFSVAKLVPGIGIWRMRRWGLFLAVFLMLVSQSVLLVVQHWTIGSLLVGLIEIGIVAKYWRSLQ